MYRPSPRMHWMQRLKRTEKTLQTDTWYPMLCHLHQRWPLPERAIVTCFFRCNMLGKPWSWHFSEFKASMAPLWIHWQERTAKTKKHSDASYLTNQCGFWSCYILGKNIQTKAMKGKLSFQACHTCNVGVSSQRWVWGKHDIGSEPFTLWKSTNFQGHITSGLQRALQP